MAWRNGIMSRSKRKAGTKAVPVLGAAGLLAAVAAAEAVVAEAVEAVAAAEVAALEDAAGAVAAAVCHGELAAGARSEHITRARL
jgi:hypothetical protein